MSGKEINSTIKRTLVRRAEVKEERGAVGNAVVMGVLERGETYTDKYGEEKKPSPATANVIADTSKEILHGGVKAAVEPGHLLACLDEQAFWFNERKDDDRSRFLNAMRGAIGKRLAYHQLIG